MITDEIKDYSKIIGISVLSILKFGAIGIVINWLYGLFKISWYVALFNAGGWLIAVALLAIVILFAGIPALYMFMGYQTAIGKAISNTFNKNKITISNLLTKVARKIARVKAFDGATITAASAKEYRLVNFIIKHMGFKKEWDKITSLKPDAPQEEKEAVIQDVVSSIVLAFPEKIAEGFTFNFRTVLLVNIIGLLVVEVISRIYP